MSRRAVLAIAAALAFLGFVALAARVWDGLGPLAIDQRVMRHLPDWLMTRDAHDWVWYLSYPGRPSAVGLVSIAVAIVVWARSRRWRVALFCLVAPSLVAVVAEQVLKPMVDRRGVKGAGLYFPSGHVVGITSVAVVVWLVLVSRWPSRSARIAGAAVLVATVATVSLSRVALRTHYPTDVLGGALYAVAATLALAVAWPSNLARSRRLLRRNADACDRGGRHAMGR
jgi:membrane-associated phospholipid phosphatase